MKKTVIIKGGGFGGVWGALSAARCRKELKKESEVEILLISKDVYYGLRPRYYEADLKPVRVPLSKFLEPVGVKLLMGEVTGNDRLNKTIQLSNEKKIILRPLDLGDGKSDLLSVDSGT